MRLLAAWLRLSLIWRRRILKLQVLSLQAHICVGSVRILIDGIVIVQLAVNRLRILNSLQLVTAIPYK